MQRQHLEAFLLDEVLLLIDGLVAANHLFRQAGLAILQCIDGLMNSSFHQCRHIKDMLLHLIEVALEMRAHR